METIRIEETIAECVAKAAAVLARGGVILYPTDTLYGLGVDALSHEALKKLYVLKGRDEGKPVHSIVSDLDMASRYGEVGEVARMLADAFLPGALTLLLKKNAEIPDWAVSGRDTFGIRIPDNEFCIELARAFGKPYTATSANVSGMVTGRSVGEILAQFGERASLIDLVIDAGELSEREASTVVDVSGSAPIIVREGAISKEKLSAYF